MSESPYERIDRLQIRGFMGLLIAAMSPVIADVGTPWIGWPMAIIGGVMIISSLIGMGR